MESMKESDVQDKQGNIVIAPDLKVRHKDSQFEYTVDSVVQGEKGENVILLRLPEEPRFDPDQQTDTLMSDLSDKNVIYETDPSIMIYTPDQSNQDDSQEGEEFLAVPQKEFEKEYEVK
tara:strand:+ start:431 stop:787 length:357 start_codon:yes stop_codon:yes gene_type:complete